ncbi:probable cytochrome P450 313a3 [Drosophila biarmipes]|uniref:probable cytochrome P450 313a3 n=1 Tax=Drosophila biarmipes TaxID=125945 RepID=UPI0007E777EC|nr:probable cytochrome P450 313a3 [Drosophila biarmipes]
MVTFGLLLTVGLFFWIYFLWSRRRLYKLLLKLPGPLGLPILGIALEYIVFNKLRMRLRSKYLDKYGSTVLMWMGPMPMIITRDPNVIKEVVLSSECINRSSQVTGPVAGSFGHGLFSLEAQRWMERRKQLNPAFKHTTLTSFLPIFNAEVNTLMGILDSYIGQGEKRIRHDIIKWSFRVATQTTVGTDVQQDKAFQDDTILKSYEWLMNIITVDVIATVTRNKLVSRLVGLEARRAESLANINGFISQIIEKKLSSKPESGDQPELNSVINRSIELHRKGEMPLDEVRGECCLMVAAAFETSGLTVCHALALLAMFPEYQQTVYEELKDIFPNAGKFDITYEDIQKMVYLERVVYETLRLIPSIPLAPRETIQDFRLSSGVVIPKGVSIGIDIFSTHRNKEYWGPDAENFNPDNFLPDNVRDRHPYAYIPFTKGKRNCIGWQYALMSSKLALAKILRNYRVSSTFRYEDLDFVDNIGMVLAQEPGVSFHRRT